MLEKYTYRLEWSEEDQVYLARCLEFPSLAAHGDTEEKALSEIKEVVNETVKWLKEEGEVVPQPICVKKFKGNLTLRITPDLHKELVIQSAEEGVSINKFILSKLVTN